MVHTNTSKSRSCGRSNFSTIATENASESDAVLDKKDMLLSGMTSLYAAEGIIKLYGVIGRGSFATVFHCKDDTRGEVAVKFFDLQVSFRIECQELQRLRHPNLVRMYRTIPEPSRLGLVLELCGHTLDDLLHTPWGMNVQVASDCIHRLQVGIDVSRGLKYLHRKEISHGDVTPKTIFLSRDLTADTRLIGPAKLGGFASLRKKGSMVKPLSSGSVVYMAPEEMDGSLLQAPTGFALDAYAFGVLLYEICSRARPYCEHRLQGDPQLLLLVKAGLRPDVTKVPADPAFSHPFGQTIQRRLVSSMEMCWCQDANNRPMISDVAKELKDIMKEWLCMRFCKIVATASTR
jgi:serine/threonine protein kinase